MSIIIPFDNKMNGQRDSIVVEHSDSLKDIAKSIAKVFKDEINFLADTSSFRQFKSHKELPSELSSLWLDKLAAIKSTPSDISLKDRVSAAYVGMMDRASKRGTVESPDIDVAVDIAKEHIYNSPKCMPTIMSIVKSLQDSRVCNGDIMVEIGREIGKSLKSEIQAFDKTSIENTIPESMRGALLDVKQEKTTRKDSGMSI